VPAAAVAPTAKGPAVTPRKKRSDAELEALIARLRAVWPLAFAAPVRSLAIGADRMILEVRPPGVGRKAIKRAMEHYASGDAYLAAVRDGVHRVALGGSDAGEPDEANRAYARQRLEKRSAAAKETPS
jgi:sRNA-binding protein